MSAQGEVVRRVREDGDLLLLSRQVHDRVSDDVYEIETIGKARRSHVADLHTDSIGTLLTSELLHHLGRELDTLNADPTRTERQCNPARTDGELERGTIAD
jgi:hypothetical protein